MFDQAKDPSGRRLHELTALYGVPPSLRKAAAEALIAPETQQPGLFADAGNRLFSCHSGPATVCSAMCLYHQKAAGELPEKYPFATVEARLMKSANFHAVAGEIEIIKKAIAGRAAVSESALPDEDFALVWQDAAGSKTRHYPLRNPGEVKQACDYLLQHRREFRWQDRQTMANKILLKCAEMDVGPAEAFTEPGYRFLLRTSGRGVCSGETAARLCMDRAKALRKAGADIKYQERLADMAQKIMAGAGVVNTPSNLVKVAAFLDQVDAQFKLKFDELPEDSLFLAHPKDAEDLHNQHVPVVTGNLYRRRDLERIDPDDLRDALGTGFADAVTTGLWVDGQKMATLLPTLPRPDAVLFEQVAAAAEVRPVLKQATAQRLDLAKLASLHRQSVQAA